VRASFGGGGWSAVVPALELHQKPWAFTGIEAEGRPWREDGPTLFMGIEGAEESRPAPFNWHAAPSALFERSSGGVALRLGAQARGCPPELVPAQAIAGAYVRFEPERLVLREPLAVWVADAGVGRRGGLYRYGSDGWEWAGGLDTSRGGFVANTRRLGTFTVFSDTLGPRILRLEPAPRAARAPYSRWTLEARLTELGSGVDARASYFVIDGRRVPSEWDSEAGVLRWRPLKPPSAGPHRYGVIATDRAGNVGKSAGSFVLD
jgi:hypothetical protein